MVVNIITFLGPKIVFLIVFLLALIIFLLILIITQKKLSKKATFKQVYTEKEINLIKELENLRVSKKSQDIILGELNYIAREIFNAVFKLSKSMDYSEMILYFKQNKKFKLTAFCQKMLEALYSGEKISSKKLWELISDLETIINDIYPETRKIQEKIQPDQIEELPITKLNLMDEEQLKEAYKKLQIAYAKVYEAVKLKNNAQLLDKLVHLRENIYKRINEYLKNPAKIIDLAHEISSGISFLKSIRI